MKSKKIYAGYGLYFDSELHMYLYADFVRVSTKSQKQRDRIDVFFYLVESGFTAYEANTIEEKGAHAMKLVYAAMKYRRLLK